MVLADIETEPRGDPPPIPPLIRSGPKASNGKLQDETLKPPPSTKVARKAVKSENNEPLDHKIEEVEAEAKVEDEKVGSGGAKKKES